MEPDNNPDGAQSSKTDLLEQARQFLTLSDIVERYPDVISRRLTGLVYILIGGGLSLATLLYTQLMPYIIATDYLLLSAVVFVILSMGIAFAITFGVVVPLGRGYASSGSSDSEMSLLMRVTWTIITAAIVVLSAYAFSTAQEYFFPIAVQVLLTVGLLVNCYEVKSNPKEIAFLKSHVLFALIVALSTIPILLLPNLGFIFIILFDIGGIFGMGMYMVISAEKMLIATFGSG